MWNVLSSSLEPAPAVDFLRWQFVEPWSRSVEAAYRSMIRMTELTVDIVDHFTTLKHIDEVTRKLISGTHAFNPLLVEAPSSSRAPARRVALVTGGCGGIGTEICRRLAKSGMQVVATYIVQETDYARQWQMERRAENLEVAIAECDVTDFQSCTRMAASVEEEFGGVDVLVNCAGITRDNTLRKMDESHWHAVLDTNLDSVFNVTKQFIDGMSTRRFGRIISISSVNGQKGQFGQTNYSAAKAGMTGFTRSLARELADQGITVNTLSPGYVNTRMAMAVPKDVRKGITDKIPVGRFAEPSEIAHAVAFLASDESGYITGSDLSINGGLFMY